MSIVEFKGVTKRFGTVTILDNVDLSIPVGEKLVLIGPSGSGKSTLLRCINALEEIDGGDLMVDGHSVKAVPKPCASSARKRVWCSNSSIFFRR